MSRYCFVCVSCRASTTGRWAPTANSEIHRSVFPTLRTLLSCIANAYASYKQNASFNLMYWLYDSDPSKWNYSRNCWNWVKRQWQIMQGAWCLWLYFDRGCCGETPEGADCLLKRNGGDCDCCKLGFRQNRSVPCEISPKAPHLALKTLWRRIGPDNGDLLSR